MSTDIASLLAQARRPERTIELCLRGDLVAEYEDLLRRRDEEADKPDTDSLDGGPLPTIAAQLQTLRETMRDSSMVFRMRALPRKRFRELVDRHPPRKGEDGAPVDVDAAFGVSLATLPDPLIRACLVAPALTEDQLTQILDEILSDRQYDELFTAAWSVNRATVDVPFSSAASAATRNSDAR